MRTSNPQMSRDLFLGLLNHGILMAPRAMGAICTPMTDEDLRALLTAVDEVVSERETDWRELGA
jgi:glutamate-1-semialdehyde aminotransferase